MSVAAGVLTFVLVVVIAGARPRSDARLDQRRVRPGATPSSRSASATTAPPSPRLSSARLAGRRRVAHAAPAAVGRRLRRLARRPTDDSTDRSLDRRAGWAAGAVIVGFVVGGGPGALTLAGACWWAPLVRRRAARRHHDETVLDEVPDLVDLFRLATSAGLNLRESIEAVARHADGVVAGAVADVARRLERGDRLADAVADLSRIGEPTRPLIDALLAADRAGTPIGPALDRVADAGRQARRRRREEAARALPVKLLFPLVFCTLPALGLLTVVPVVARSWPSLVP